MRASPGNCSCSSTNSVSTLFPCAHVTWRLPADRRVPGATAPFGWRAKGVGHVDSGHSDPGLPPVPLRGCLARPPVAGRPTLSRSGRPPSDAAESPWPELAARARSEIRNQNDAFAGVAPGSHLVEGRPDAAHRSRFHQRRDLDIAGQNPFQDVRVMLRRASPGAADFGIEGRELGMVLRKALPAVADQHQHSAVPDQFQSRLLSLAGPGHLKYLPTVFGIHLSPPAFGEEILFDLRRFLSGRRDDEIDAVTERMLEFDTVPAHTDHRPGAEESGPLSQEHSEAAGDTDNDDSASSLDAASTSRLVRRGDGVGDDGQVLERDNAAPRHRAQFAGRNGDMRGETAVNPVTIAGHPLAQAPVGPSMAALLAFPARYDGGHDDLSAQPGGIACHHCSADLVSENQGRISHRRYALVEIAEVGSADAAAGYLDKHLARLQLRGR